MTTIRTMFAALMAIMAMATPTAAQTDNRNTLSDPSIENRFDDSALQRIMPTRYGGRSRQWREQTMAEEARLQEQQQDSLHLPQMNRYGQPETIGRYPLDFGGWYSWGLHRGLNVQVGASVFAQFGKGAHSGAGFQQNIALMYATPLSDKLSLAVGGYLNNVNYAGGNWHDAGLSAVLGYRFNEHWEAYIYGQKSISSNMPRPWGYGLYDGYYGGYGFAPGAFSSNFNGMPAYSIDDLNGMGDRIGATMRYNFNNNMSIEVSVENRWLPTPHY